MVTFVHVWKEYRRGDIVIHALRDVSFHIGQGEFCALMGPSGSGKSTFLNVIAGLDQITSGDILLEGKSTTGFSDADWTKRRREFIGMVFQAFHLVPGLTAAENVGLPLLLSGKAPNMVWQRVAENLEVVGMQHRAQHRPGELSGGEQQRVAIARAVVHRPRLVLADEPTGNLDSHNAAEVVALLRRVSRDWGQTVILATHSEAAAREADRRYLLRDGELLAPSHPPPPR
ncbi:MAG: ABC transporter ATP-binding protein [Nitrospirales bacterium]